MPQIEWSEAERKSFQRDLRAGLWTFFIVLAILLATGLVKLPDFLAILAVPVYAVALWIVLFKLIRVRWPQ